MKYKMIGLLAAAVVALTAFAASAIKTDDPTRRIHQHLEARQKTAGCSCDGKSLCTHLPLVLIDTGDRKIPGEVIVDENQEEIGFTMTEDGETMLAAQVHIVDHSDANNHPDDAPTLSSSMLIRIRGNSSRYFEKKSYLLRLTEADGSYNEQEVLGMEPHYEWALHGPYMDKSLIRNYMWYNIAGEIMDWAPNVRFCEVIVNGEYQGLYLMTETITSGKESRLKLTEPMQDANKTGFVVRLDRGSSNPLKNINTFTQYAYRNLQKMDIKYPRAGDLTPELAREISQEVSDFEKTLYSYDYDTDDYGYWHSIDTDSFVDFFILNEFTANYDAGWLSTYLYKDVGGKYKMVIWDFNSACENYRHLTSSPQHIELQYNIWYYMLTKDEYFNKKILRRYKELREDVLSDEFLIRYIDETVAYLGDVIERNFAVWGDSFDKDMLEPSERNPRSYQEAVDQMKRFIQERGDWLDNHLEIILQYSHESKIKKFNH